MPRKSQTLQPLFSNPFSEGRKPTWSVAALIHGLRWGAGKPQRIAEGISIAGLAGSPVDKLYRRLCAEHNADDGEPLGFHVYLDFKDSLDLLNHPLDPCSPISRGLTLTCALVGAPPAMCRTIWSADNFSTAYSTDVLFDYRPQFLHWELFLQENKRRHDWPDIDKGLCRALAAGWPVAWSSKNERLARAMVFFQHAWLAHDLDHMCLNLAIVLEALCAPHSQGETTHQISFNVAHLTGGDAQEKRQTYDLIAGFTAFGLPSFTAGIQIG